VRHRPLAFVLALAAGDYLLWNWSLAGGHDVLALIAGLTLPPLAIAAAALIVLSAARLVARSAQPRVRRAGQAGGRADGRDVAGAAAARRRMSSPRGTGAGAAVAAEAPFDAPGDARLDRDGPSRPSSKLAA
jgi:hypothetical protein